MVSNNVKSLVDKYLSEYAGGDPANFNKKFFEQWIQNDPESAYNQLYVHAQRHYDKQGLGKQQAEQANYFNGLLSKSQDLINQNQAGNTTAFNKALTDVRTQAGTAQAQTAKQSSLYESIINSLRGSVPKPVEPVKPKIDTGEGMGFNGLLSSISNAQSKIDDFRNGLRGLGIDAGNVSNSVARPSSQTPDLSVFYKMNADQIGLANQSSKNILAFNNAVAGQRQGLLSQLDSLNAQAQSLESQYNSQYAKKVQERLGERSSYFANQAQMRQAQLQAQAQNNQARAVIKQRDKTRNTSGLLSSLTR